MINNIEDLREACFVDDVTECWMWRMATSQGRPSVFIPARRKTGSIGTLMSYLLTGSSPEPGMKWIRACREMACCSPFHGSFGSAKDLAKIWQGERKSALHRARIVAGTRANAKKCNPEMAALIRANTGPLREDAARYGISTSLVSLIRRQKAWRPLSPWSL